MAEPQSPMSNTDNDDETPQQSRTRKRRASVACVRCNTQKIRCTGEFPKCGRCQASRTAVKCEYPFKDREVKVKKSYLKSLQDEIGRLKRLRTGESVPMLSPAESASTQIPNESSPAEAAVAPQTMDGTDLEGLKFAYDESSIQPAYVGEASCTTFANRFSQYLNGDQPAPAPKRHRYYQNSKLLRISSADCQLPNRNHAILLVKVVLRFVGADYHLLGRLSFLERLDETYKMKEYDDPIFLCRMFTVFALGELYSAKGKGSGSVGVPGTSFFLKAVSMFQDLYEEPSIQYIEALLLLTFYSVALNRRNTAYTYTGIALRLSLILGLHRKIPNNTTMTPMECEHRIRVWWSVYSLDRVCSSKVGHPVMLRDEDIDVQLPSTDGLTPEQAAEYFDPVHLTAQIKLMRITGNVLSDIYRIPQPGRSNQFFVVGVQKTLANLRSWHEMLPPLLRLNHNASQMFANRSVASLHLHFCQCVILTTRPILFHVFRSRFTINKKYSEMVSKPLSPMTIALAEACIQTARTSNSILAQLWVDGCLAIYGFFDALSIFSSTVILMMSSALKQGDSKFDDDAIEIAWNLLRSMRDDGNIPASCYFDQLVQLKADLDDACERNQGIAENASVEGNGLELLLSTNSNIFQRQNGQTDATLPEPHGNVEVGVMAFPNDEVIGAGPALNDPYLDAFLRQQQPLLGSWPPPLDPAFDADVDWNYDWQNANLY